MIQDTPRKKRRREKLVGAFRDDWELELAARPLIRRRRLHGLQGLWRSVTARKHSVFAMYWFFKHERLGNQDLRKFDLPLKHDGIPTPGVPTKYELQGSWEIRESDLPYLFGGPLVDQHGDLLVPADAGATKLPRPVRAAIPTLEAVAFAATLGLFVLWIREPAGDWEPWTALGAVIAGALEALRRGARS